jgi:hypothetical protein
MTLAETKNYIINILRNVFSLMYHGLFYAWMNVRLNTQLSNGENFQDACLGFIQK